MTIQDTHVPIPERTAHPIGGAKILPLMLLGLPTLIALAGYLISQGNDVLGALILVPSLLALPLTAVGFFVVQPNASMVMVFFGKYRGTVLKEGFYWVNPFTKRSKISLRANNLATETIKVNDLNGNPIEIGAIVVWRVRDTARASFEVENYEHYVEVQVEAGLREMAKTHPYEEHSSDGDTLVESSKISLRDGSDEVSEELLRELQERLERAGIEVLEARISHLAYALEIASAMLQRQQAAAIISARRLIVNGAVGMVEQALGDLEARGVVDLDDSQKAAMVSNLLVVLCSGSAATPVLNAGGA